MDLEYIAPPSQRPAQAAEVEIELTVPEVRPVDLFKWFAALIEVSLNLN